MIGSDIDGTLLDYNYTPGAIPDVNIDLIRQLRRDGVEEIALISNQGGLPFGIQGRTRLGGGKYPAPADFVWRFIHLVGVLALQGIRVVDLHVCTFHPRTESSSVAADMLDEMVANVAPSMPRFITAAASYRKPNARMLIEASIDRYYGDSDEDEQAATTAGIEFVRVERFFGAQP